MLCSGDCRCTVGKNWHYPVEAQRAGTGHHHAALLKHPPLAAHAPSPGFAGFVWEVSGRNLSSGLG